MMEIERPKIDTASLSADGRYGKFVVEPLERGFRYHLGQQPAACAAFLLCRVSPSPASRLTG